MKVVLFCGGMGTRLREYSEVIPKPMVPIGYRPILWHVMKYYASYGHKDFILCLGYKADVIKHYFLQYEESLSNDFVLSRGGRDLKLLSSDIDDWNITFVDTGVNANVGQRLKAVEQHLAGEEVFLANYSDGLTDLHLPDMIEAFYKQEAIGAFLRVRPSQSFHLVVAGNDGLVTNIRGVKQSDLWINGGYFVFKREIFDYLLPGEELVEAPFQRLIDRRKLLAYTHTGFWGCMDTYKEKQQLDDMYTRGERPWETWRHQRLENAL